MAQLVTLSELKERARDAADMVGSTFVSDAELTKYLNQSLQNLYDLLTAAYGQEYYFETSDITIVNGTESYDLPSDFYKLLGVDLVLTNNPTPNSNRITLKPYMLQERNRYKSYSITTDSIDGTPRLRYRLQGDKINFIPIPNGGYTATLLYIPAMTKLSDDADTFDGVNGWEEYAVLDTAIKMMRKEEGDTRDLRLDRLQIKEDLISMARDRDAGQPERITDVTRQDSLMIDQAWDI